MGVDVLVMVCEEMLEPYDNLARLRYLNCFGQIGPVDILFSTIGRGIQKEFSIAERQTRVTEAASCIMVPDENLQGRKE